MSEIHIKDLGGGFFQIAVGELVVDVYQPTEEELTKMVDRMVAGSEIKFDPKSEFDPEFDPKK